VSNGSTLKGMSFALHTASPYMLRYAAIAGGAGTDNTLTQAQMLADAHAGPLKTKLQVTNTLSEWTALIDDPEISVYVSPLGGSPAVVGYGFGNPSSVSTLQLTALAAGNAMVEIRFNHTIDR